MRLALGTSAGQPDAITIYAAQLINVRRMQGRVNEMVPLIEQAAIIDRVGALTTVCDELEATLRRTEECAAKLAEAAVRELVV